MAKAYKCDRCGNYFEKNKLLHNGEYFVRKAGGIEGIIDIDLCESCNSKFQIWMDEFKIMNEESEENK